MPEKKTAKTEKPSWVKLTSAELEKIVVDLAKQGMFPEKIGLILRDKHGIPKAKLLGKKISQIIKESGIAENSRKNVTEHEITSINSHIAKNKHDYQAKRALTKKLWNLHKLSQ